MSRPTLPKVREYVSIFPYQASTRLGGWQVRGTDGQRHEIVVAGLNSREMAEAWIRHLTDSIVKADAAYWIPSDPR